MGEVYLAGAALAFLLFGNPMASNSEQAIAWSQPPVQTGEVDNQPVFRGWNVVSIHNTQWRAADDWQNVDMNPVTGINWWGSYVCWKETSLPPVTPTEFWFGIYGNAPVVNGNSQSRPGNLLWSYTSSNFTQDFVGYDALNNGILDTTFRYTINLPQEAWFTPESTGSINWLSIAAVYEGDVPPVYQWGWKTRPHFFGSDGVWMVGDPPNWVPLQWDGQSWDTSFELITTGPGPVIPEFGSVGLTAVAAGLAGLLRLPLLRRPRNRLES